MASYFELTTIEQNVRRQGLLIAEHLVEAAQGTTSTVARLSAPTRLIVRGTTQSPGTARASRRPQRFLQAPAGDNPPFDIGPPSTDEAQLGDVKAAWTAPDASLP
jgi:hypothetical protein